jgi:hypothetical protein
VELSGGGLTDLPVMHVKESNGAVFIRLIDMKDMKINHTNVTIQMGIASAQYLLKLNKERETVNVGM